MSAERRSLNCYMTQMEMTAMEVRLRSMVTEQLAEMREAFVTRQEFKPVAEKAARADRVLNRAGNLLIYIGVLATLQLLFGNRWAGLAELVAKMLH